MKKLLIIHNKYRITGGEDIVVEQETKVLEKYFIVNSLIFSNKVSLSIKKLPLFLTSRSKESRDKLTKVIDDFDPDIALVHNTWFNASLSIFDVLKEKNIQTILKLHNFRYFCTKNFFHKNHIQKNEKWCIYLYFLYISQHRRDYLFSEKRKLRNMKYHHMVQNQCCAQHNEKNFYAFQ